MKSTSAQPSRNCLLFSLLMVVWATSLCAQPRESKLYKVTVVLLNGERWRGILGRITEETLLIEREESLFLVPDAVGRVDLRDIKRVVIRQDSKRQARIKGALVGGLIGGYTALKYAPSTGFRSSAVFGLNLAFTVGTGAATGTLAGQLIGNTKRIIIRATSEDPLNRANLLRLQLEPYSYYFQNELLKRADQQTDEPVYLR